MWQSPSGKRFSGVLLASDIDGTLLGPDGKIPGRNKTAIEYFLRNGGLFTLATARDPQSARWFYQELTFNAPAVLCNGALLYDFAEESIAAQDCLLDEAAGIVRELSEAFPDVGVKLSAGTQVYLYNKNEAVEDFIRTYRQQCELWDDPGLPVGCNKVVFICKEGRLQALDAYVRQRGFTQAHFTPTCDFLYEMMPSGVTKGSGLLRLAELLRIEREHTYAIGDFYNDLEMFACAGHGVTVAGAPQEVKDCCEIVVGPYEHGAVADLIELLDRKADVR